MPSGCVLLDLWTWKIKSKCIKSTVLGTLPLWNGKNLDPYQIEKQDPDPCLSEKQNPDPYQKGLDPQHCYQAVIFLHWLAHNFYLPVSKSNRCSSGCNRTTASVDVSKCQHWQMFQFYHWNAASVTLTAILFHLELHPQLFETRQSTHSTNNKRGMPKARVWNSSDWFDNFGNASENLKQPSVCTSHLPKDKRIYTGTVRV